MLAFPQISALPLKSLGLLATNRNLYRSCHPVACSWPAARIQGLLAEIRFAQSTRYNAFPAASYLYVFTRQTNSTSVSIMTTSLLARVLSIFRNTAALGQSFLLVYATKSKSNLDQFSIESLLLLACQYKHYPRQQGHPTGTVSVLV